MFFLRLHLFLWVVTLCIVLFVSLRGFSRRKQSDGGVDRVIRNVVYCWPLVLMGVVVSLLLMVGRKPQAECIAPCFAYLFYACVGQGSEARRVMQVYLICASVLVWNWLLVASASGVTLAPHWIRHLQSVRSKKVLQDTAEKIRSSAADPLAEYPAGSAADVFPNMGIETEIMTREPMEQWHTPISGAYPIEHTPMHVQFDGGNLDNLEAKLHLTETR